MAAARTPPNDLSRVRVLFPDHHGLARGKYLPMRVAADGTHNCITLFALDFDRTMVPAPGAMLLEGNPDMKVTFDLADVRPGWEEQTGIVVGDLSFADEPLAIAPRNVLKQAIADWRALGYEPMVGIELEAFVLEPDGNGSWREWTTPGAYVYGTGRSVDPVGLIDDLMRIAESVELPIESINSEYETPQFELTLGYTDALRSVDNTFLFKVLARELAQQKGLLLTYMGKPFGDRGGSGLHVNFSLRDEDGRNAMEDTSDPDGLSSIARACIAGLLEHHEGMAAICAPTVNAYKRLRPGQLSGYWANWGKDHRSCTVRVPSERGKATRLEHRMSDGAANPYLATAAVLQAARLGTEQGLTPPPPETLDAFEQASTERHVPENLSLALDALESDKSFVDALGSAVVEHFVFIKRNEWSKFAAAVTDWELRHYLPFL
jgi:glutamine synthetase